MEKPKRAACAHIHGGIKSFQPISEMKANKRIVKKRQSRKRGKKKKNENRKWKTFAEH